MLKSLYLGVALVAGVHGPSKVAAAAIAMTHPTARTTPSVDVKKAWFEHATARILEGRVK